MSRGRHPALHCSAQGAVRTPAEGAPWAIPFHNMIAHGGKNRVWQLFIVVTVVVVVAVLVIAGAVAVVVVVVAVLVIADVAVVAAAAKVVAVTLVLLFI